jgi:hypothetical protein
MTNYEIDERAKGHFKLLVTHEIGATNFLYDSAFIRNILLCLAVPQLLFDSLRLPLVELFCLIIAGLICF